MKRILAFLVSMSLILACLSGISLVAYAADLSDIGVAGEGTATSPFIIDTADKFVAVFGADATTTAITHTSKSVIYVTADIDLSTTDYAPHTAMFQGTLKGWDLAADGETMRTINIGDVTRPEIAGYISSTGTKKVGGGVLGTTFQATISHFIVTGKLTSPATDAVGGFIAYDDKTASKISYIENRVDVTSTAATQTGGVIGFARAGLENCSNYGTINGFKYTGGIIGAGNSSGEVIKNCANYGAVSGNSYAGGIIGSSYQGFEGCINYGTISCKGTVGGIAGYNSQINTTMKYCANLGTVYYNATGSNGGAGGLIGRFYFKSDHGTPSRPIDIVDCYNLGAVTGQKADGTPHCAYGACVGDIQGTGSGSTLKGSIDGFYDLVNEGMPLYSIYNNQGGTIDIADAYVVGEADGANTATLATMKALTQKAGSAFAETSVWTVDASADYKYPTLVLNSFDDNLPAFDEPEAEEPEEPQGTWFEQNSITGEGTEANPYIINTAAKFNAIFGNVVTDSELLDTIRRAHYAITADIDLSGTNYVPNSSMTWFVGSIKGKNESGALTQRTINLGTITITGAAKDSSTYAGGIVNMTGYGATFSHLTLEGTISSTTAANGSGVLTGANIGGSAVNISNIVNNANITSAKGYVGGIIGRAASATNISNCVNNGAINATATGYAGGIVGDSIKAATVIENCHNKGAITLAAGSTAGGIAGRAYNAQIKGCSNTATITNNATSGSSYLGGIVGVLRVEKETDNSLIENCWNSGTIVATRPRNGGIVGIAWRHKNASDVANDIQIDIINCYNVGTFSGGATDNGHIVGYDNIDNTTANANPGFTKKLLIQGCYAVDADYPMLANGNVNAIATGVTYLNNYVYTLNDDIDYEGAEKVNKSELIGLTSEDEVFMDSEVWAPGSGSYPYPQLVGNPYTGALVELPDDPVLSSYTVDDIEVYYDNGAYKIRWTAEAAADSYEIKYGDNTATVTLNGDITSIIRDKELDIQIYAIKGSTSYPSEVATVNGYYGGGTGVTGDEYLIYDAYHFANIELNPEASYKQMADFTITEPIFLQEDKSLGYSAPVTTFEGIYDGNNKVLTLDFTYNNTGDPVYAPFAQIAGATIKNLTTDGTINLVAVGETIYVAGIVGNNKKLNTAYILNCVNKADIIVGEGINKDIYSGGIIGISYSSSPILVMKDCENYGNIAGKYVGGIIGYIRSGETLENCANYGDVIVGTASGYAGGIAGRGEGGTIINCFNMGNVTGASVAGIVGYGHLNSANFTITNCFNIGTLTGSSTSGILRVGKARASGKTYTYNITNCYNVAGARYALVHPLEEDDHIGYNNAYYANPFDVEGAIKLEDLKTVALGDAYEIKGDYAYPQLKSNPIDADKAAIEFVTVEYVGDGSADVNRQTIEGYIVKGATATIYVTSRDPIYETITVTANENVVIKEGITDKTGIKYIVNEDTVLTVTGVKIEAGTPEITAGTEILASTGETPITVGGTEYTRYAISAGRAPKVTGLKLKEFGVLINLKDDGFTLENAKAVAKADSNKISESGAYGVLIYGDGEKGIKSNMTYYTRPYAIYEDADGNEKTAYGEIQSFVLAAPVTAE